QALLALVLVEIATGVMLYLHAYQLLDKRDAALAHLATTFVLALPFGVHLWRGVTVALDRRAARAEAYGAAEARGRGAQAAEGQEAVSRRAFLRMGAMALAGLGLAFAFGRYTFGQLAAWRVNRVGAIPPLTKDGWRLRVTGLVATPVEITFDELRRLPVRTLDNTNHRVEGWSYTDTFTGVALPDVLALAGRVLP